MHSSVTNRLESSSVKKKSVSDVPVYPIDWNPKFEVEPLDLHALRQYRLNRVRKLLKEHDCMGGLFFNPINIRYATDSSNMQVWTLHNPSRYLYVAVDGPVVLFDYHGCGHLSDKLGTVDEVRGAVSHFYFQNGVYTEDRAQIFGEQIAELVKRFPLFDYTFQC